MKTKYEKEPDKRTHKNIWSQSVGKETALREQVKKKKSTFDFGYTSREGESYIYFKKKTNDKTTRRTFFLSSKQTWPKMDIFFF